MNTTNDTCKIIDARTKKKCNRGTALERSIGKLPGRERGWGRGRGLKLVLLAPNLALNFDAVPNYKNMFDLHRKLSCLHYKKWQKSLRKHAFSNILKILPPKMKIFR